MPQISSRPQTLRQARRAYQRSGGVARLTERERRQLERSAELQERAGRIRERENKRKANIRKKNERIEREREARQRMGIASPSKETVSASQMRLSKFLELGTDSKRKGEQSPVLTPQSSGDELGASQTGHAVEKPIQERRPLEPLSHNPVIASSAQISARTSTSDNHNRVLSAPTKPKAAIGMDGCFKRSSSKPPNVSTVLPQPKPAFNRPSKDLTNASSTCTKNASTSTTSATQAHEVMAPAPEPHRSATPAGSMRPPPRPTVSAAAGAKPSKINNRSPIEKSKSPIPSRLPSSQKPVLPPSCSLTLGANLPKAKAKQPSDDSWAAFLVSNTQIERELSTPETMLLKAAPATTKMSTQHGYRKHGFASARQPPKSPPLLSPPPKDEAASLLAGICTQDLNYASDFSSDEPEEELVSPNNEVKAPRKIDKGTDSFGGDELSNSELEDAVRDAEHATITSFLAEKKRVKEQSRNGKESFCDEEEEEEEEEEEDGFDLSTQELCDLVE